MAERKIIEDGKIIIRVDDIEVSQDAQERRITSLGNKITRSQNTVNNLTAQLARAQDDLDALAAERTADQTILDTVRGG